MDRLKWAVVILLALGALLYLNYSSSYSAPRAYFEMEPVPYRVADFDINQLPDWMRAIEYNPYGDVSKVYVQDGNLYIRVNGYIPTARGNFRPKAFALVEYEPGEVLHIKAPAVGRVACANFWYGWVVGVLLNDIRYVNVLQLDYGERYDSLSYYGLVLQYGWHDYYGDFTSGHQPPEDIYIYVEPDSGVIYTWDGGGTAQPQVIGRVDPTKVKGVAIGVDGALVGSCSPDMYWVIDKIELYKPKFLILPSLNFRNLAEAGVESKLIIDGVGGVPPYEVNVYLDGSLLISATLTGFPAELSVTIPSPGFHDLNVVATDAYGSVSYRNLDVYATVGRSQGYGGVYALKFEVNAPVDSYTVRVTLPRSVVSDVNGVRFYSAEGYLLPAWTAPPFVNDENVTYWVAVPHLDEVNNTILLYTGSYPSYFDSYRTFDSALGFDEDPNSIGDILPVVKRGTYTVSDGVLHVRSSGTGCCQAYGFMTGMYYLGGTEIVINYRPKDVYAGTDGFYFDKFYFFYLVGPPNAMYPFGVVFIDDGRWVATVGSIYYTIDGDNTVLETGIPYHTEHWIWAYIFPDQNTPLVYIRDLTYGVSAEYNLAISGPAQAYLQTYSVSELTMYPNPRFDIYGENNIYVYNSRRIAREGDPQLVSFSELRRGTSTSLEVNLIRVPVPGDITATVCSRVEGSPLSDATVRLLMSLDQNAWEVVGTGQTGSNGCHTFTVHFEVNGTYYLKGETLPGGDYLGSESDVVTVEAYAGATPTPPPSPSTGGGVGVPLTQPEVRPEVVPEVTTVQPASPSFLGRIGPLGVVGILLLLALLAMASRRG